MVGCSRCTFPSIHFFVSRSRSEHPRCTYPSIHVETLSKSRSVVRGVVVCCGCMRVLCCVVCCMVCVCFVVVLVLVLVFGGGGVVWWLWYVVGCCCVFLCLSVLFFRFLSLCLSLSCSLSFFLSSFLSSLFSHLSLLFLFFFSLLLATKHFGKNRSTNTAANIEASECDLAQGKCTAVGSLLLLSPPSSLLSRLVVGP